MLHELTYSKSLYENTDGESVKVIKDDDSINDLLYYEPRFIV